MTAQADALMEIFGFKRVADDEIVLDNPPSLDDDSGSLNEGMEMDESAFMRKVAGQLAPVVWQFSENGKWYTGFDTNNHRTKTEEAGYPIRELCTISEALAGYAVRDARIAELEAESAEWSPVMQRLGDENQQLRAELAAAKETIALYEVTAENCDLLRAELAAIKGQVPDIARFEKHAMKARECLSECDVVLLSSIRRLIASPAPSAVVMPDKWIVPAPIWPDARMPYGKPHNGAEISAAESVNLVLDEVARLNPAPATPVEQCTNEDSWNCKYCRKTNGCKALSDPRNFGSPASADVVQVPAVPDGYKVVPIEPTKEMMDAALMADCGEIDPRSIIYADYKAMLAASPAAKGGDV